MRTQVGQIQERYGARGSESYWIEVFHPGLHKHRLIRGPEKRVIEAKARLQAAEWDNLWEKKQQAERRVATAQQRKEEAATRTAEAQQLLRSLQGFLAAALSRNDAINWDELKDRSPFPRPAPNKPRMDPPPEPERIASAPDRRWPRYQARLSFLDKLVSSRRLAKEAEVQQRFDADMQQWEQGRARIVAKNQARLDAHRCREAELEAEHERAKQAWQAEKDEFLAKQSEQHAAIDAFRTRYESKEPPAIVEYCDMVLAKSEYPDCLPQECDLDFNGDSGVLIVNYKLPAPEGLPTLCEVKYVQSTDTFAEKHLPESQVARLYDDLVYQITLRSIHELFEADRVRALTAIVFNGFVTSTDKSTGNEVTACILSVQTSREAFTAINLSKVDPKPCFRQLKGVGSSKMHSITPVAPIMNVRREDERFIESYGVADRLHEGYNLAAMDWEDFEHLIREIFEKEFSSAGGEVRVTQASRDGGVDAVAFDPDPIRGGKIVIQAKRYAYTVGVSAVRDLYGTLLNEGATKGILVTTSDYGPDAYEFASAKPITLLNGSNLLHLLRKHGVKAHINLSEARQAGTDRSAATN